MARNSVAANLLMLLFLVGGLVTFTRIKQEVFPDVQEDIVSVRVVYPGASPEEVEQGIVLAVEEALSGLEGIEEIRASATEGLASVRAEILEGTDAMKVYQDIKSEIDRIITFPEEAEEPEVSLEVRRRMVTSVVLYGATSDTSLRELAEQARASLLQSPLITQVDLFGVRPFEIRIEVPQENLRRYGLTLQNVADRLRQASVDVPGGGIKAERGEILLRMKERRDYGREFARTPIITGPDGAAILLEDIAEIIDGFEDTDRYAVYNGQPAVMLNVYRVGDQTPISVSGAVQEKVEQLNYELPEGITAEIRYNAADMYRDRAELLLRNGALGLVLVLFLLGLFLELRLALWVLMGIPVSFLGSLLLMPVCDLSINMVTMFAYILALGIVVDDAIVVGENIYHHHQEGKPFMRAAVDGAREVASPVAFSILTNIVAFIPLYFLPGMMGRIMKMLPVVVVSTFLISWVESIFILPSHLGHHRDRGRRGLNRWFHERQQAFSVWFMRWVQTSYGPFLERCLHARYVVLLMAAGILTVALCYVASGRMGFEMFPKVESDYAYGYVWLPYGVPIERSAAINDRLLAAAKEVVRECGHPELVKGYYSDVGDGGSHTTEMRVYLADPDVRKTIMGTQEFVDRWRVKIGDLTGVDSMRLSSDEGGPGSGKALTIELAHRDVQTLERASSELAAELAMFPQVKDIDDGFQLGKEQLDFSMRPDGERLGLTAASVARQVRNAYEGAEVLRQQRGRNEVKVRVYLSEHQRESAYHLENMVLRTPSGGEVPLQNVVNVKRGRAYTAINRRNSQRTMWVTGDVTPRAGVGQVIAALEVETLPALLKRYPGLSYSYEGHQAEDRKTAGRMRQLIPLVLVAIYALLAIPFRSYLQPLIVMTSIPFGVVGAICGHLLMGYNLSMIGLIGILALSGVVVNDALVLIDFANHRRQTHASAHDAVVSAGIQRFRPIMLTTLTTFGGLAPMIFETSRQARFLIPMALSLGYGMLFATLITLILVPSLYMVVEDVRGLMRRT
jgi:multidrug efflux pump subunit AcrB